MSTQESIFASHALRLRRQGLAVLPVDRDKRPAVSGFQKWSRPPSEGTITKWARQYQNHNIAIVPGLSDICVVDADEVGEVPFLEDLFGATPLRVITGRGKHLYYRKPCDRLPGNLRKFGLRVDLKCGNTLAIAPPSIHQTGARYVLDDGSDWAMLRDLPPPNLDALHAFMDRAKPAIPKGRTEEMRDGSRKQWLNDELCRHACSCDTFGALLDVARTLNERLSEKGFVPLEDEVVVQRTEKIWTDVQAGKLESWYGGHGVARARDSEIDLLARLSLRHGSDAVVLLLRLRVEHSARCLRGESFAITPKEMARHQTIPRWSVKRYTTARDLLLQAKLIDLTAEFQNTREGRKAAQYRLTDCVGRGR